MQTIQETKTQSPRDVSRIALANMDAQRWDQVSALVSPKVVVRVGGQTLDKAQWMQMGLDFYGGFPDGVHTVEEVIVADDKVVTRATWRGTHSGSFMGMPATGRKVSLAVIMIDRVVDGLIVERAAQFDSAGMMQQLTSQ